MSVRSISLKIDYKYILASPLKPLTTGEGGNACFASLQGCNLLKVMQEQLPGSKKLPVSEA